MLLLSRCIFEDNTVSTGAAVTVYSWGGEGVTLLSFTRCVVRNNRGLDGGAVAGHMKEAIIHHTIFEGNSVGMGDVCRGYGAALLIVPAPPFSGRMCTRVLSYWRPPLKS